MTFVPQQRRINLPGFMQPSNWTCVSCPSAVKRLGRAHSLWFWGAAIFVGRSMCECVFSVSSTEDLAQILLFWWKLLWIPLGDAWIMRRHHSRNDGGRSADLCLVGPCVYQASSWWDHFLSICWQNTQQKKSFGAHHDSHKQQLSVACLVVYIFGYIGHTAGHISSFWRPASAVCLLVKRPGMQMGHRASLEWDVYLQTLRC